MATNVSFVKGLREKLPDTYVEGRFLVTTDERAIYLDLDSESTRIRLGDFQEVQSLEELRKITKPSTTALYYIKDDNILAKYEGSDWKQINPDTGATGVETEGQGNAVTGIEYDEATRKLKVKLEKTFLTGEEVDGKISTVVGEIPERKTVAEYIEEKTKDIASESEITDIKDRLTTIEGDGDGSIKKAVDDAKTELTESISKKADLGTEGDESSVTSLYGVKKHAEEKAAEEAGKVKTELLGTEESAAGDDTIKGVKKYTDEQIKAKLSAPYKPGGSAAASKFESAPTEEDEGKVFNASEEFETNENFVDAASKKYPAGTNVVAVKEGEGYKWDVLSGFVDLTEYAKTEDVTNKINTAKTELTGDETDVTATTIQGAAKEAKDYAKAQDEALKSSLVGTDAGEADTIKGAVKTAKEYADGEIEKLNIGEYAKTEAMTQADQTNLEAAKAYTDEKLTWGEF